jgi:glycosyltransferase involved in cell wall biosynthesis
MSLDVSHSILQTPLANAPAQTIDMEADRSHGVVVVVAARNEADRIAATLAGLTLALPGASVWVADDASHDATAELAGRSGAHVLRGERRRGKGGSVTAAVRVALEHERSASVLVLCDGDLAESARELGALAAAVADGRAELAVGVFATRVGGGVGLARGFAGWAIGRRCGLRTRAPISGQRALSVTALSDVLPFAAGYGMELGMTIDAVRAGHRVLELELDLSHRGSGRTPAGFAHRARQLADFVRAYVARA